MAKTLIIVPEGFPRDPIKKMMLDTNKLMYQSEFGGPCYNGIESKTFHVMDNKF